MQRNGLQLLLVACCAAALVSAVDNRRDDARVLQSEPLTSAWSPIVPAAMAEAGASVAAKGQGKAMATGKGKGFDVHQIDWKNKKSRGACCRICPNIFYAVPRVVPRPNPHGKPKPRFQQQKEARAARFAAVFDRREPPTYDSEDSARVRPPASEQNTGGGLRPDRFTVPEYPPWPLGEYTDDPYQDQPIPEFTKAAELPGLQCCNICPSKGIGQLKYPDFLKWGESPATDDYPEPPWDIPCCKLCSKGCFSNGSRRPPPTPAQERSEHDEDSSFAETDAATDAATNQTALLAATMRGGSTSSSTRKPKAYKARGNWPKTLDPPGANRPPVPPPDTQCLSMVGCCQVCYNHPFVYDHAPSGIW